ncbi:Na+/H+ antiporter NhaC family protein [Blautia sp. 2744]|uniref:Na+/H+ antiporter NhaC family protein n=1 Tax=Blautia intestinalis TaxID=2763028 RepID=A0ABR7I0X7_9FIRM|nr:Na+/H+ antiporter NhaC family protein [Blautia intestinalis]MBC5740169.1 Na+/H+ antiporter NhaC family protein [Blautia intestinalis]RHD33111.1 Na+/H+ antiporter NhaC family protein [Blautia obeum]
MDGSMFIGTWWSLVPPLLAIVLALATKEVYSSLFIGVAMGALLYTGFHPWNAFVAFFDIMKNSMNLNILIFDVLLGMIIVLMSKSGGSAAYGKWAGTKIKSKKSAMLATTGLGVLIFVDDYFNCLTVGSVMRPVTDRFKVSRAKLAYIIDATAAPVCIIAPISSWAAAVNSYVPEDAGISGFQLFLRTIPYNLYAILTLLMVFTVILSGLDFGLMKKHEKNAANGDLFTSGGEEFDQVKEEEISSNGKVIDLVLPVLVLIVTAIGAMIYTGFLGGATDVVTAFAGCDAETSLIFATLITVMFMLVLYLPRKVITFKGFMDSFVEGFKMMIPAIGILIFAWSLKGMGDALEIASFVEKLVGSNASASVLLPAILFLVAIFLSFSTGTSWGTFAILVPIAIAMFPGTDNMQMMIIAVASVLSGAVCGDHVSPISDTTVMSSAGAQSNHINHVTTQMQYAVVVAVVSAIGYVIAGFVHIWWLVLGISAILLLVVLFVIKAVTSDEKDGVKKRA